MTLFLFIVGVLIYPNQSLASIGFEDAAFPELATSGRALALGNAYISKVDDASSAFYNPAGLGTVRYAHFHISNLHLEVNKGWMDMGTGGSIGDIGSNFMKGFKLDGMRELLKDNPGKLSHSRFHLMPNFTARFISAGYLYSTQSRGTLGTEADAQFEYADRVDSGPYLSLNISLFGGVLKFGATGIYLTRKEAFGEVDPDITLELEDSDYKKGSGFILISGLKLTLPWRALPTLSVKVNNSSSQEFSPSSSYGGAPEKIKPSVDLGVSFTPQIGKTSRLHFEINYKDFSHQYDDTTSSRRLAVGLEIDMSRIFFVRFGYGDGFGSGGLGIRSKKLDFDLTTYAVDSTTSEFRGKEDRRFVMSFSSGF